MWHRLRTRGDDQADATLAYRLVKQLDETGVEHLLRNVAEDDRVILGKLIELARQCGGLEFLVEAAPLGFEEDVGLVRRESAEAVVALHRVFQETEVPARQSLDVEDLQLLLADADERDVGVVAAQVLRLLRLRWDVNCQIAAARLCRLEDEFELLLFGAAQDKVLRVDHPVVLAQLDLDGPVVEAGGLDGDRDAGRVADRHQTGRENVGDANVLQQLRRADGEGEQRSVLRRELAGLLDGRAPARVLAVGEEEDASEVAVGSILDDMMQRVAGISRGAAGIGRFGEVRAGRVDAEACHVPGERVIANIEAPGQFLQKRPGGLQCGVCQLGSRDAVQRQASAAIEAAVAGGPGDVAQLGFRLERASRQLHALRVIKEHRDYRFLLVLVIETNKWASQHKHQQGEDDNARQAEREPQLRRDGRQVTTLAKEDPDADRHKQDQSDRQHPAILEVELDLVDVLDELVSDIQLPQQPREHRRPFTASGFGGLLRLGQALEILLDKRSVALGALLAHALEQVLADTRRQLEQNRPRRGIELCQLARGAAADRAAIEVATAQASGRRTRTIRLGLPARRSLPHPRCHSQRLLHPRRLQHLSQRPHCPVSLRLLALPARSSLSRCVGLHCLLQPLHHLLQRLLIGGEGLLCRLQVAVARPTPDGALLALEALVGNWLLAAQRRHELILLVFFLLVVLLPVRLAARGVGLVLAAGQRLVGVVLLRRYPLLLTVGRVRRVGELRRATLGLAIFPGVEQVADSGECAAQFALQLSLLLLGTDEIRLLLPAAGELVLRALTPPPLLATLRQVIVE